MRCLRKCHSGLNDPDRYRVKITEEYVKDVDVVLFLMTSGNSYSQTDKDFLLRIVRLRRLEQLRLVVTKCDVTFDAACRDAAERDEDPPSFEDHLKYEELRLKDQLAQTLDELLRESGLTDAERDHFEGLLSNVPINFTSHVYYQQGYPERSGIPRLRSDIRLMLEEGGRAVAARSFLRDAISRACDRVGRSCRERLEIANKTFDPRNALQRAKEALDELNGFLNGMEEAIDREAARLDGHIDPVMHDLPCQVSRMLDRCEPIFREYERTDLNRTWQSRRNRYWGFLDDLADRIASHVFPRVELLLAAALRGFENVLARINSVLRTSHSRAEALQRRYELGESLREVDLAGSFSLRSQALLAQIPSLRESVKNGLMRRLGDFITADVNAEIEAHRTEVQDIRGKGTLAAQENSVREFYAYLRTAIREALLSHLRNGFEELRAELASGLEPLGIELTEELQEVLQDRIWALESRLKQQTEQDRDRMVSRLSLLACRIADTQGEVSKYAERLAERN